MSVFRGDVKGANSLKNHEQNHYQGIIFVLILCQKPEKAMYFARHRSQRWNPGHVQFAEKEWQKQ